MRYFFSPKGVSKVFYQRAILSLLLLLFFIQIPQTELVSQQQDLEEVPRIDPNPSPDVGNDTNYSLIPGNPSQSFDKQTNPTRYPTLEEINRNTISTSLIGLSQGFLYIEWEHLLGRMVGFVFGATFYASEIGQTRRLFAPANLDNNSFTNLGGILGFTFYISQQYAQGLAVQIKFGGGILAGSYTESGTTDANSMFDFYGSAMAIIVYRLNITHNIALSPLLMINGNIVIVAGKYDSKALVPSYYFINGHSDLLSLAAPADLSGGGETLLLFMHVGLGVDLTFTF